jgi:site-specific DNA recombinase
MNAINKNSDIIPVMKAVLFCRVSSREQEETGYSLPSQQKLLSEYSNKKGFSVTKVFLVSESASGKKQRTIFNEMVSFVRKEKIKIIICEKTDRLTRNLKDTQLMYDWLEEDPERQIHLVKDSLILHKNSRSQEKLNLDIRVVFAKNYIDNLSEEVKKGQKEKIAQGWLPTRPPLGYLTIGEDGRKTHIVNEKIRPFVQELFSLYATGEYSLERITHLMYQKGFRNANGGEISRSWIHLMLGNHFYYGKIMWNGEIYEGKQEPIVTQELFDQVQKVLVRKKAPKYSKHFFLFRQLITCKGCQGVITWETKKNHVYGHCNYYRHCPKRFYVKEGDVELQLIHAFSKLQIKNPRINNWLIKVLEYGKKEVIQTTHNILSDLQEKLNLIEKQIDNLYDDKTSEKITEEFYQRKLTKYSKDETDLKKAIANNSNSNPQNAEAGLDVYKLSQRATILFKKAKPEQKRALIKLVFDELVLNNGIVEYSYSEGFILLYALVNSFNCSKIQNIGKLFNETLEQEDKIVISRQIDSFEHAYPVMLGD